MRLAVASLLLAASLENASAFIPSVPSPTVSTQRQHRTGVALRMAEAGTAATAPEAPAKKTGPASPEELLKRARRAQGLPEDDDEHPKLFEDSILDDFQECLLKLERRVKEGPGSISADEVLEFEAATGRIIVDMHGKLSGEAPAATAEAKKIEAAPAAAAAPPAPVAETATVVEAAPAPPSPVAPQPADVIDTSNDEGPAYTGEGGLGLATGTRNTWVIPGMDEMSPGEYQKALQESVMERQERRREANRGVVGNRAAHSYLDTLGWGGAESSLAAEDSDQKGKEIVSRPDLYDA